MRHLLFALILALPLAALAGDRQTFGPETPAAWSEHATASNAVATATHTGAAGIAHYVTKIVADCDSGSAVVTVRFLDGATVVIDGRSPQSGNMLQLDFASPYRATLAGAVSADLSACGGAIVGRITLLGYSRTP